MSTDEMNRLIKEHREAVAKSRCRHRPFVRTRIMAAIRDFIKRKMAGQRRDKCKCCRRLVWQNEFV